MTIDWKTVLSAFAAALIGAGGTVGAQRLTATQTAPVAQLQLIEGMTGLCVRVEKTGK